MNRKWPRQTAPLEDEKQRGAHCEFCGTSGVPKYAVSLGQAISTIYRCPNCHAWQVSPKFPESALLSFYERSYFQEQEWEIDKAHNLAADYVRKLEVWSKSGQIRGPALEVGAGYGFFAAAAAKRWDIEVDIVEPSDTCRRFCRQRGFGRGIHEALSSIPDGQKYSTIFCFHIVEHLQEFGPFLGRLSNYLNPDGEVWILTPNADSWSFRRLGANWIWACSDQHYEFLSSSIPGSFYAKQGFHMQFARDLQPASVHFPSAWLASLLHCVKICEALAQKGYLFVLAARIARRMLWELAKCLAPNRKHCILCALEKKWALLANRRPHDELLLLLKKV